ncbi:MAG: EAL domain-containing protein [Pseudomonadota bacterium]|nr:EAL domain-containing protein [Pseudomonadota bacterium]
MHHIVDGLIVHHNLWLVAVGALVCVLAAFTLFTILDHAHMAKRRRVGWLVLAALISATGTWATHFIAMLAYNPGIPVYYDPALTLASAFAAFALMPLGWWLSLKSCEYSAIAAGLLVAAGICTMHYVGMAAMRLSGILLWNPGVVAASVIGAALFSVWAVRLQRRQQGTIPWRPSLALIGAICTLHFIGMGALTIIPVPGRLLIGQLLDNNSIVALVLAGTVVLVVLGFLVVILDRVIDREKAAARIVHLAYHDALTGLSNRLLLDSHLLQVVGEAKTGGEPLAVVCIDLDGFKGVNDAHGHGMGDGLLVAVAGRLQGLVKGGDLVARTGGDEFVIVQRGGVQPTDARTLAERVIAGLARSFAIHGETLLISASVGVAIFPNDSHRAGELSRKADVALYRAKALGRGVACFYDGSIEEKLRDRFQLKADMALAIHENQFRVEYQPIVDAKSGALECFEALLRWDHPQLGLIAPQVFIPLAEEGALIQKLGLWVLRKSCRDAARWDRPITLCVNVSPLQFLEEDLGQRIAMVLAETELDPRRLEIEVTESALLINPQLALSIFSDLKALGVRVSLDDFGTGFSSLSYFKMFPFDKVKIDQSFVADMSGHSSREIIRSVIDLSRRLGIIVVAEGVEQPAQLEALREMGCTQVQGFLIGRPKPIEYYELSLGIGRRARAKAA